MKCGVSLPNYNNLLAFCKVKVAKPAGILVRLLMITVMNRVRMLNYQNGLLINTKVMMGGESS